MNNYTGIVVEGVSKKFAARLSRSMLYGMQDVAREVVGLPTHSECLRPEEFWAVRDVSFELKPGDTLGIVGPNGSGKSTLLKMLNGIIKPDKGEIRIRGRVGALIEVGAGFHPMLTGRENIQINGAILGMSRVEIRRKFDSIVEFAEMGDFLDLPVKNYSSGMYVRLGFAIAAHSEPDILLVDEVLAVGDIGFQKKCFKYFEDGVLGKGVMLCLVSHNIHSVARLCSNTLILKGGGSHYWGSSIEAIPEYYRVLHSRSQSARKPEGPARLGAGEMRVVDVRIVDSLGRETKNLSTGDTVEFEFRIRAEHEFACMPHTSFKILDLSGTLVSFSMIPPGKRQNMRLGAGENILRCRYSSLNLMPGQYSLELKLGGGGDLLQDLVSDVLVFDVTGEDPMYASTAGRGLVYLPNAWEHVAIERKGAKADVPVEGNR